MVPNGHAPGYQVTSWSGCGGSNYPDQWWVSSHIGNGAYELRNDGFRSLCLAVPNRSLNAKAIVATCDGSPKQQWEEVTNGDRPDWSDRMLRNRDSGLCLISQATSASSDPIIQWNCVSYYRDQWWYFYL